MGYNDEDDDENTGGRQQLYNRFRQSLSKPVGERYFDEDELVEIFDYAGDINDNYVRIEVLCCGARLYPESTALADRRALLYLDEDDSDRLATDFMADNAALSTPIADIVKLEINPPAPDQACSALDFFISQYEHLGDEETIRFVNLAADLGQYQWLLENLPLLRSKTSYLPSLLFEVLTEADEEGDNDTVCTLADELIELEPFSVTYWTALFRGHARAGRESEAKAAFDYARALASDDLSYIDWLCESVYSYAPYLRDETIELLESAMEKAPDEFRYADLRCGLLMQSGNSTGAIDGVKEFLDHNPGNYTALRRLLSTNARGIPPYIEAYYAVCPAGFGAEAAEEIINQLQMAGAARALNDFLSAYSEHETLSVEQTAPWAEALFALDRYEDVVRMAEAMTSFDPIISTPIKGASFAVVAVISMMKTGRQELAQDFIGRTRPVFEAILMAAPLPIRLMVKSTLNLYETVERHPAEDKLFWEYHDPFKMGKL